MRWVPRNRLPLLMAALLGAAPWTALAVGMTGGADDPFDANVPDTEGVDDEIDRRRPSWFHRPEMETPAEQLALAERLRADGHRRRARSAYRDLIHQWNDSDEAVRAQMAYAETFEERGRWERAFEEYQRLVKFYVGRFPFDEIITRQTRLAEEVAAMRHGRLFGMPGWQDPAQAVPLFETLLANAPRAPEAPAWQLRIGEIREADGELELAVLAYERAANRYAGSAEAESAAIRRCMCLYRIALRRDARSERALQEAVSAFETLIDAYPRAKAPDLAAPRMEELIDRLADLHYARAVFYDYTARRPVSACLAYLEFLKRFPASAHASTASARVEALRKETASDDAPQPDNKG